MSMTPDVKTAITGSAVVSIFTFLGVIFTVLKLTGTIGWSWVWVTLPWWGIVVLIGCILFFVLCTAIVMFVLDKI